MIAPEEAEQRAAGVGRRDQAAGGGSASRLQAAQCDRNSGPFRRAADRQPPNALLDGKADARIPAQLRQPTERRSSLPPLASICGGRMARQSRRAVFNRDDADRPGATLISLEDERVRGLTNSLPVFAPGQPIPSVVVPDVSDKTTGVWSLWRISLHTAGGREQRFLALFVSDDGRVFGPTARTIWDRLIDLPAGLSQATGRSLRRRLHRRPTRPAAPRRKPKARRSLKSYWPLTSSASFASARRAGTRSRPVVAPSSVWVCPRSGATGSGFWLTRSKPGTESLLRVKPLSRTSRPS